MPRYIVLIERRSTIRFAIEEAANADAAKDAAVAEYEAGRYNNDRVDYVAELMKNQGPVTDGVNDVEATDHIDAKIVHELKAARDEQEETTASQNECHHCGADISAQTRTARGEALIEAMPEDQQKMIKGLGVPAEFLGHRPTLNIWCRMLLVGKLTVPDSEQTWFEVSWDECENWEPVKQDQDVALQLLLKAVEQGHDVLDALWRGERVEVQSTSESRRGLVRVKRSERVRAMVDRMNHLSRSLGLYVEQALVEYGGVPRLKDDLNEPGPPDERCDPKGGYSVDEDTLIMEWKNPPSTTEE